MSLHTKSILSSGDKNINGKSAVGLSHFPMWAAQISGSRDLDNNTQADSLWEASPILGLPHQGCVGQGHKLEQARGVDSGSHGGGVKPTGREGYLGTHSCPDPSGGDSRRLESLVQCFSAFLGGRQQGTQLWADGTQTHKPPSFLYPVPKEWEGWSLLLSPHSLSRTSPALWSVSFHSSARATSDTMVWISRI